MKTKTNKASNGGRDLKPAFSLMTKSLWPILAAIQETGMDRDEFLHICRLMWDKSLTVKPG